MVMTKNNRKENSQKKLNEKLENKLQENQQEFDQKQSQAFEKSNESSNHMHNLEQQNDTKITDDELVAEEETITTISELAELNQQTSPHTPSNINDEAPQIMTNHPETPQTPAHQGSKFATTTALIAVAAALGSAAFSFVNNQQAQTNIASLNEKIVQAESQVKTVAAQAAQLDLSQIDKVKSELNAELKKVSQNVIEQLQGTQSADGELRQSLDNSLKKIELLNNKLAEQGSLLSVVQTSAKTTEGKINSVEVSVKESLLQQQATYQDINKVAQTIANATDMQGLNLAEVHYLIKMADHKLQFEHDKDTAIIALEKANQRLSEVKESAFTETQNRIKETLAALNSIKIPPREEMLKKLNDISARLNGAPILANAELSKLRSDFSQRSSDATPANTAIQKIWDSIKHLFVIEKKRVKTPALMAAEDAFYLNQNIQLQLNAAKNTVIENLPDAYLASINQTIDWIKTYYNQENAQVALAIAELNQLKEIPLRSDLPKVTAILSAFEASMQLRKGAAQ